MDGRQNKIRTTTFDPSDAIQVHQFIKLIIETNKQTNDDHWMFDPDSHDQV